jgi:hypothetical protein
LNLPQDRARIGSDWTRSLSSRQGKSDKQRRQ